MAGKPPFLRFFQEASAAVLDFTSYRRVFQQPILRSLFFLLQLTVLSTIVLTTAYSFRVIPQIDHFLTWALTGLPPFSVEGGQLRANVESPATFVYPGTQLITFVFDLREDHVAAESLDQPAVLLTRDSLHMSSVGLTFTWEQLEALFANREEGIRVDVETIEEMRQSLGWMAPIFFVFSLFVSLIAKCLQAVLLSALGILASSSQGIRLPFSQYLTIAIYALTPAMAIDALVTGLGQSGQLFELIYLFTAALYTYLATQRCLSVD